MSVSRVIEFSFSVLAAFIILVFVSFLSLRPMLKQVRLEAGREWTGFAAAVSRRDQALPGVIEALRGYESGHAYLAGKLLEARSISLRPTDPDKFVAAVDVTEGCLIQIEEMVGSGRDLDSYPPFAVHWKRVEKIGREVRLRRMQYNMRAALYNGLLNAFPQNIMASVFGFVPLKVYRPASVSNELRPR